MASIAVQLIPVLTDNYVFVAWDKETKHAAVIDPAVAEPTLEHLNGAAEVSIWNTHHHWDHIGGNERIKQTLSARVFGSRYDAERGRIPGIDEALEDGDSISLGDESVHIIGCPGHTMGHICYYLPKAGLLFAGDTLFAMGCGRLFEGTPSQMWDSLGKLAKLPPSTKVYCAHEYTEHNGKFAALVDPQNDDVHTRLSQVRSLRDKGVPTIPTTIGLELATNPFLRTAKKDQQKSTESTSMNSVDVFADLRKKRDHF